MRKEGTTDREKTTTRRGREKKIYHAGAPRRRRAPNFSSWQRSLDEKEEARKECARLATKLLFDD